MTSSHQNKEIKNAKARGCLTERHYFSFKNTNLSTIRTVSSKKKLHIVRQKFLFVLNPQTLFHLYKTQNDKKKNSIVNIDMHGELISQTKTTQFSIIFFSISSLFSVFSIKDI